MKRTGLIAILFLGVCGMQAQPFSVYAKLDSSQIRVGEQATLTYELAQPADLQVSFPLLKDTIVNGLEIVEERQADTLDLGSGRIQVNKCYVLTSFDSGFYMIPAQVFASAQDKVESQALGLAVQTVQVGEEEQIADIKDVMNAPFSWREFFRWAGLAVAILLLVAGIAFVLIKYVFKRKIQLMPEHKEPEVPAHERAMQRLQAIKDEKLWQSGKIKEFYTEVTDVLRVYIEGRFDISAMEMTTEDLLLLVRKHPDMEEVRTVLRQLLELSDLVKFAKLHPMEMENDQAIAAAFEFVEKTKPAEPLPEPKMPTNQEEGKL